MDRELEDAFRPSRLRALLGHFAVIEGPREAPRVRYPLREVLFLAVAATIADCEDYDEIAHFGGAHLPSPHGGFRSSTSERPPPTGCAW